MRAKDEGAVKRTESTEPPWAAVADLIRCPQCRRGQLTPRPLDSALTCSHCSATFPMRDGHFDLLGEERRRRTFAQRTMESNPIIRIYESRLWRRNPILARAMGLSFEREHELVAEALSLEGVRTLLDLGCGPGIHTRPFAHELRDGVVVGLDLSSPMLRYARKRADAEGLTRVVLIHGDALDLPFPDERFDAVNCCGALHLFPDAPRALQEIRRVLRPGGRFATAVYRRVGRGRFSRVGQSLDEDVLGFSPFRTEDLEAALVRAGFADVRCLHDQGMWLMMSACREARARSPDVHT